MNKADQFDLAFDPIGKLAQLLGSVRNLGDGSCTMTDGNETLSVSSYYCPFCNAIHGNPADGEADCIHKRVLKLALALRQVA